MMNQSKIFLCHCESRHEGDEAIAALRIDRFTAANIATPRNYNALLRLLIPFLFFSFSLLSAQSSAFDALGITVFGGGRQYVFTNKEAGTYHGEVNGLNTGGWQGWFINAEKIFHDYSLSVKTTLLDRTTARSIVFPHQLIRTYQNGTKETFTMLDSVDILLIEVNNRSAQIALEPTENFSRDSSRASDIPHWKRTNPALEIIPTDIIVVRYVRKSSVIFAIAAGRNFETMISAANNAVQQPDRFITRRKKRMELLLSRSSTSTNNKEVTMAIAWAKLQVDALIMNQSTGGARTKGIFAGLPWFNNYWGRDSFISLPGATYVIGNTIDARDVLRSYAAFQELDTANSNYGRIPNLATPQSVIYNTADGAPWFVKSFYEYVKYSGDLEFVNEMYPVVSRSIDGTIKYHCDTLGFLTHADAESWMDAVGPDGPWSPRGSRACDVQALWHQQLMVGVFCAEYFNDFHKAARWKNIADKLERNFTQYFVDTTSQLIYDHLKRDGTPSVELRPNQLFTFDMAIPEQVRQSMVRAVLNKLVYEHGTTTLAQNDSNFHPFHEYPPYYVKDAAYHNGIVWTWLNGAAIYAATRYDLQDIVYPVTKNSIHQILRRGTVGALSELLDAHPRLNAEPKLSGTYSQAWSLAEFIRSMYQDYFGVSVDIPSKAMRIQPKLPAELTAVDFVQRIGTASAKISYRHSQGKVTVTVVPKDLKEPYRINYLWVYPNGDAVVSPVDLMPGKTVTIEHTLSTLTVMYGKKRVIEERNNSKIFLRNFSDKKYFADLTLALPETERDFPVLRGPSHPLLSHAVVRTKNPSAEQLADATDPEGDDTGVTGAFHYPQSQFFKKGILDITRATFRYDDKNLYCMLTFAHLNDPGWHPEYGFQLTMAAIAVNTGGGYQTAVGSNSDYLLDSTRAFDRLILVGGGVRISDGTGKIICEYIPRQEDAADPIGNVRGKVIEFAVPLEYLGKPSPSWKFSILVGAQDDHGGAGIGEFRFVQQSVSEWLGGGKTRMNDSNIYDVLVIH